jgi:hypothetical protein
MFYPKTYISAFLVKKFEHWLENFDESYLNVSYIHLLEELGHFSSDSLKEVMPDSALMFDFGL